MKNGHHRGFLACMRKSLLTLTFVPRWLTSADFRLAFASSVSANKVCIKRELLDRFQIVFENW